MLIKLLFKEGDKQKKVNAPEILRRMNDRKSKKGQKEKKIAELNWLTHLKAA